MTEKRFNCMLRAITLCPRGEKYFCDGRVNRSQDKAEELTPLKPCTIKWRCPVKKMMREFDERNE